MRESRSSGPSPSGQPVGAAVESTVGLAADTPLNGRPALPKRIDGAAVAPPETTGDIIRDQFGRVFDYLRIAVTDIGNNVDYFFFFC
jgi:hypothetical protein